jgi:hypothetical protein
VSSCLLHLDIILRMPSHPWLALPTSQSHGRGCFPSLSIVFASLWPVHGRFINCMLWLRLGARSDPLAIPRQLFARFEEAGLGSESWRVSQPPRSHPNNTQTPQESGEVQVRTTKRIVRRAEVGNQRLVRSGATVDRSLAADRMNS